MAAAAADPAPGGEHDPDAVVAGLAQPLRAYLRRYCGDPVLAEDLAQETLLRVVRSLPRFEGRSSLRTWAFSIATRVAADHFRRASPPLVEWSPQDECGDAAKAEPSPEARLVVDEMNTCVRRVIDTLPPDYRAALVLRDLEGLSVKEVADVCGCTLATAKIRLHRGRRRLAAALEGTCDFYVDDGDVLRCDEKAGAPAGSSRR